MFCILGEIIKLVDVIILLLWVVNKISSEIDSEDLKMW